jgi:hypothetical protein
VQVINGTLISVISSLLALTELPLHYITTGDALIITDATNENSQNAFAESADKLLRAAAKYQVLGLMHRTEEYLSTALDVPNALGMMMRPIM